MPAANEDIIWSGTPSQVVNLKTFLITAAIVAVIVGVWTVLYLNEVMLGGYRWVLLLVALLPLLWAGKKWLDVRTTQFELTTQRLRFRRGLLAKHTDELELYRVRDWQLHEPLLYRLFRLGTLTLITSDQSTPTVVLPALPNVHDVREQLRTNVEIMREKKKVREVDFE